MSLGLQYVGWEHHETLVDYRVASRWWILKRGKHGNKAGAGPSFVPSVPSAIML